MDYQNNQQPQGAGVNSAEARLSIKRAFEAMTDKVADFFQTNFFLRLVAKISDIIAYAAAGACLILTILNMAINGSGSPVLGMTALIFALLALSKKTVLPLAVVLSELAVFSLIGLIMSAVSIAGAFLFYVQVGRVVVFVFNFIFTLAEIGVLTILAIVAWSTFVSMLEPKQYQQPAAPRPQQPAQPTAPQPQQPVQPAVSQPQQPIQPVTPAAQPTQPADGAWTCSCGGVNSATAKFCKNCGKPRNG